MKLDELEKLAECERDAEKVEPVAFAVESYGVMELMYSDADEAEFQATQYPIEAKAKVIPLYAHPAPAVPEVPDGWQTVPKEMTDEMYVAARQKGTIDKMWVAALYAAPTPPTNASKYDYGIKYKITVRTNAHPDGLPIEQWLSRLTDTDDSELREAARAVCSEFLENTCIASKSIGRLRKALK